MSLLVIFSVIATASILWYLAGIIILRRGLNALPEKGPAQNLSFSIIIAARNEQHTIEACLRHVFAQTMATERFEVIVVNDRSYDNTPVILEKLTREYPRLKHITIHETPQGVVPKKNAIVTGLEIAEKDIICLTDADCLVPPGWLESLDRFFTPETGLVQGITTYRKPENMSVLFFGLQATDFISHGIVAAAAIGAGIPINSNANNLSFRRSAFEQVGGYGDTENIVSGDDDLLLQRINNHPLWKVVYMTDKEGMVETWATPTLGQVLEQRKRWASITVHYDLPQTILLSGVFILYTLIVSLLAAAFFYPLSGYYAALLLIVKLAGECVLMLPGLRIFHRRSLARYIIPASFLQLPLVLFSVIAGVFGRFSWKEQGFRRKV